MRRETDSCVNVNSSSCAVFPSRFFAVTDRKQFAGLFANRAHEALRIGAARISLTSFDMRRIQATQWLLSSVVRGDRFVVQETIE